MKRNIHLLGQELWVEHRLEGYKASVIAVILFLQIVGIIFLSLLTL